MNRQRRVNTVNAKERFFKFDPREKLYVCSIGNCDGKLKGKESSLRRHIAHRHPKIALQIGLTGYQRPTERLTRMVSDPPTKRIRTIVLPVHQDHFFSGLIEMVVINLVPLSFFDSPAFSTTSGLLASHLGIDSDSMSIANAISEVADVLRGLIAAELKHNMYSIKFDAIAHGGRKLLGMNVHYLKNGEFIVRTLSMEDVTVPQTMDVLKSRVEAVLATFQIDLCNVYSWITDNGKNMVKCDSQKVDMVRVKTEESVGDGLGNLSYVTVVEANPNSTDDATDLSSKHQPADDDIDIFENNTDESWEKTILEDDTITDELLQNLENLFLPDEEKYSTTIKCGMQTLFFVVKDSLNSVTNETLNAIRMVVRATRQPEYRKLFELANIPLPKSDTVTRWGSLWSMVESVFKYRIFYEDMGAKIPELYLSSSQWSFMEEFIAAYEPIFKAAETLQTENCTMGDVYKSLKLVQYKVKKISAINRFVPPILQAIEKRMKTLYENDLFKTALLFDQRWCFLDSPYYPKEDKLRAIDYALKIYNLLKSIKKYSVEALTKVEHPCGPVPEDEFEAMLEEECMNESSTAENSQVDLKLKLIQLANTKTRMPIGTDILKHWEAKRIEDNELYELAMIALGTPATQITLNRCYKAMKLIRDQNILRMSPHTLHDMMIIRLNADLLPEAINKLRKPLYTS
ncbi:uncharacterized protein LOC131429781 [Malaya genurostris]|uniref:uncharacterized protein LOC131429781 n=1 Tax=Malaya genurostris TaxID=325434 RepID=UPI0026F3894E|nr:uncharacterized protein LOC131429781 [Malaya genurostris]XP_058450110.1 uncharacterized protein LOC131429781 [Malaya genurostris]